MKKRWIATMLLAAMLLILLPITPAQAVSQEDDLDLEDQIMRCVTEAVDDYAASVYKENSSVNMFLDFGFFASLSNEPEMTVKKNSPLVSTAFNAELTKEAMRQVLTKSIVIAQDLNLEAMHVRSGPSWYTFQDSFSAIAYRGTEKDSAMRIGSLLTMKGLYGTTTVPVEQNANDKMMQLCVGSMNMYFTLRRTEVTADEMVYDVEVEITDYFDFSTDEYKAAEKLGYEVTVDRILGIIGAGLSKLFLNNFEWSFTDHFEVRVPYQCSHTAGSYSWSFDKENSALNNITDGGHLENEATMLEYTATTTGTVTPYFKLEQPVVLDHNEPWVVEYTTKPASSFALSALNSNSYSNMPALYQYSYYNTWIYRYEYIQLIDEKEGLAQGIPSKDWYTTTTHYMGAQPKGEYKYSSKYLLTYRLENRPNSDGSNMIWLSIYNETLGETVYGPVPMDDYWTLHKGEKTRSLVSEESDVISGHDILINYIGNKTARLTATQLDLTIWEKGQDAENQSTMETYYRAPTCTEDGGNVHECSRCGYSYITEREQATGHSFGTYTYDNNATCVTDGTNSAACTECGVKDSVVAEGTALGHVPGVLEGKEPTCTATGLTEGSICTRCNKVLTVQKTVDALGHSWQEATCKSKKTCTVCGKTTGKLGDHRAVVIPGVEPTCIDPGWTEGSQCADCGKTLVARQPISPTWDHDYTEATCENPSVCTKCGLANGRALGHVIELIPGTAPTCTEGGISEGSYCTRCNQVLTEQQLLEPLGHDWQEADCENPEICANCGETQGQAHDHTPVTVTGTEATCTQTGLTDGVACADCGKTVKPQTMISALGHSYSEATCEAAATCADCGDVQGEALGHRSQTVLGSAATCTTAGLTDGAVCTACEQVLTAQEKIPAAGHTFGETTCQAPATCTVCSATEGEPLEHDVVEDAAVAATCARTGLTKGSHCAVCEEVLVEQQTVARTDAHIDEDESGKCDLCGAEMTVEEVPEEEDPKEEDPEEEDPEEEEAPANNTGSKNKNKTANNTDPQPTEAVEEVVTEDVMVDCVLMAPAEAPVADSAAPEVDTTPADVPAEDGTAEVPVADAVVEADIVEKGGSFWWIPVVIAEIAAAAAAVILIARKKRDE